MPESRTQSRLTVFGLARCFLPVWLPQVPPLSTWEASLQAEITVRLLLNVLAVAAVVVYVRTVEGRGLDSIGIQRPTGRLLLRATGLGLLLLVLTIVASVAGNAGDEAEGAERLADLSIGFRLVLIAVVAVTEEVYFRGYPIERVEEATRSTWAAAVLSGGVFLASHVSFSGLLPVLLSVPGVAVWTWFYVRTRNLPASMLVHVVANLPILMISR
jgi:membrane protease YdiL (CAAX protease family)